MSGYLLPCRLNKVVLAAGAPSTTAQQHSYHPNFLVMSTTRKSIMTLAIRSRTPILLAKISIIGVVAAIHFTDAGLAP